MLKSNEKQNVLFTPLKRIYDYSEYTLAILIDILMSTSKNIHQNLLGFPPKL